MFKVQDYYFKKAKEENYLARSVYKLEEIQKKYKILTQGQSVIDFGFFPGSWAQYTSKVVGYNGQIVGVDLQEALPQILAMANFRAYTLDIGELTLLNQVESKASFDVVLSDMAPATTGIKSVDQARSLNLVEQVFDLLPEFLSPGGNLVIKVFESGSAQEYLREKKKIFKEFHNLRPKSTRSVSKEYFIIGKGYLLN